MTLRQLAVLSTFGDDHTFTRLFECVSGCRNVDAACYWMCFSSSTFCIFQASTYYFKYRVPPVLSIHVVDCYVIADLGYMSVDDRDQLHIKLSCKLLPGRYNLI